MIDKLEKTFISDMEIEKKSITNDEKFTDKTSKGPLPMQISKRG